MKTCAQLLVVLVVALLALACDSTRHLPDEAPPSSTGEETTAPMPPGAPTIDTVEPSSVPNGGGVLIAITGSNLRADTQATVNKRPAPVLLPDSARAYVLVPHGATGDQEVLLSNAGGKATATVAYTASAPAGCSLVGQAGGVAIAGVQAGTFAVRASITGLADGLIGPPAGVLAWVGLGPGCCSDSAVAATPDACAGVPACGQDHDPAWSTAFTWVPASVATCAGCAPGSFEWRASPVPAVPGPVVVAGRLSLDGGASFVYCDSPWKDETWASEHGFSVADLPLVFVK